MKVGVGMEINSRSILNENNELVDVKYTEVSTYDKFSLKEELIRNEIINILAKHNFSYWKDRKVLERTTDFLVKESVVQEII
ncbi:hypothetical protein HMPREF3186_00668 [Gemella haemolysans]|jgi:hypothetical protein|uniref:Uncharacterized protein n=2 Tax=Gemella haemolysans TaxID=1379 RepID=A0A134A087_9BACL|nr:hypothetical protein HMPREF3186_00668 [Gemella haemolysans]